MNSPTPPIKRPRGRPRLEDRTDMGPEFTGEQRVLICQLLGQFMTPTEVAQHVSQQCQRPVTATQVSYYVNATRWKPLINRFRQAYVADISTVPLTHKRVRLERLEELYQEVLHTPANHTHREELLTILKEAREEAHRLTAGDTTNIIAIQFNQMTDEELKAKREALLRQVTTRGDSNGTPSRVLDMAREQGPQAA